MNQNTELDQQAAEEAISADDYHECITFQNVCFNDIDISSHIFEDCCFSSCRFEHLSLNGTSFVSCRFLHSTLTVCSLNGTTFNGVQFSESKLIGLNYTECSKFAFTPEYFNCLLDTNMFFENNLSKCKFEECKLNNSDFVHCNLKEASFRKCTFNTVLFESVNLEKADFLEAKDYQIDPFTNKIKNARFDLPEAQSFLGYLGIKLEQ